MQPAALPRCQSRKDKDVVFPAMGNLYDFFAPRTKDIQVYCYGFRGGGVETFLAETTGATINVLDARSGAEEAFKLYSRVMSEHETQPGDPQWAADLTEYWILPDSVRFHSKLPGLYNGNLDLSGTQTPFTQFSIDRLDFVKVDYDEHTSFLVNMILERGYRPGLFLIHWDKHPDESSLTMAAAGNLQTLGYRLIGVEGNYFLYIYMDQCMYEVCSWARTDCMNPMFEEYRKQVFESFLPPVQQTQPLDENLRKE